MTKYIHTLLIAFMIILPGCNQEEEHNKRTNVHGVGALGSELQIDYNNCELMAGDKIIKGISIYGERIIFYNYDGLHDEILMTNDEYIDYKNIMSGIGTEDESIVNELDPGGYRMIVIYRYNNKLFEFFQGDNLGEVYVFSNDVGTLKEYIENIIIRELVANNV